MANPERQEDGNQGGTPGRGLLGTALLLALFPLLGNALALGLGLPRRLAQGVVLAAAVGWAAGSQRNRFVTWGRNLPCSLLAKGGGLLAGYLGIVALWRGRAPSLPSVEPVLWLALWLTVGWGAVRLPRTPELPSAAPLQWVLFRWLSAVGWPIALLTWWMGPEPGEVLIRLGGSEILVAVCASVGLFVAVVTLPPLNALLAALPFAYLVLFATSRTGILILPLLVLVTAFGEGLRGGRPLKRRLLTALGKAAFVPALMIALAWPIPAASPAYPFRAFHLPKSEISFRIAEFYKRTLRSLRALNTVGLIHISTDPNDRSLGSRLAHGLVRRIAELEGEIAYRLIPDARGGELRWELIKEAARKVAGAPLGHWPVPYGESSQLDCGKSLRCAYPHNFFLEMGYHFGWIPLGLLLWLLTLFAVRALWAIAEGPHPVSATLAVAWFVHLVAIQTTGTLRDHFIPLGIMGLWAIYGWSNVEKTERPAQ